MGVDIVLLRHGRTAWNQEVRFRGRMDLPLDDFGQAQAQAVARAMQARWPGLVAIYSSPLLRARQTAAPAAAALGLAVQAHDGLLDLDYGAWTGLTPAEVERRDPQRYHQWRVAPQQVQFPAGESLPQVQERLLGLLEELAQTHAGQEVLLVGHLVVNRVLLCTLLGLGLEAFWRIGQENAAINLVCYEDGMGRVLLLNDTGHLLKDDIRGGSYV